MGVFLQLEQTAVEAVPGGRNSGGTVAQVQSPPHSAVLGSVGCFADSVLVGELHAGRLRAQWPPGISAPGGSYGVPNQAVMT